MTNDGRSYFKQEQKRVKEKIASYGTGNIGVLCHTWISLLEGDNKFRLAPINIDDSEQAKRMFVEVQVHRSIGGVDFNDAFCTMPDRGHCVVCQVVEQYKSSKDEGARELAKTLRGSTKYLVRALGLTKEASVKGVGILFLTIGVYKSLLAYLTDSEYGNITDLDTGRNINIIRQGKTLTDTSYTLVPSADRKQVVAPAIRNVLQNAKPLRDLIFYYSDEQLLYALEGNRLTLKTEDEKSEETEEDVLGGGKDEDVVPF